MTEIDGKQLLDTDTTKKSKKPVKEYGPKVKKEAKERYMRGISNTQNAIQTGVSRSTIISWVKTYGWKLDRDEIQERAREKYIEHRSEVVAETSSDVNNDHKEMLKTLREKLKHLVESRDPEQNDMSNLSQLMAMTREMVKLEREVLGLDMISKMPEMKFPTGFNIFLKTTSGDFSFNPSDANIDVENLLEASLPNQREDVFEDYEVDEDEYLDGYVETE